MWYYGVTCKYLCCFKLKWFLSNMGCGWCGLFSRKFLVGCIGCNGSMLCMATPTFWIGVWTTLMTKIKRHLITSTRVWKREIDSGGVANIAERWHLDKGGCTMSNIYARLYCLCFEVKLLRTYIDGSWPGLIYLIYKDCGHWINQYHAKMVE